MTTVFFYGLFMDDNLLVEKGLHPQDVQPATLPGFGLRIGERATLEPSAQESCYGTLMRLRSDELESLYGSAGVEDYIPRSVRVTLASGESVEAVCYLLPMDELSGSNSRYAARLAEIARRLGLPQDYVSEIETWV